MPNAKITPFAVLPLHAKRVEAYRDTFIDMLPPEFHAEPYMKTAAAVVPNVKSVATWLEANGWTLFSPHSYARADGSFPVRIRPNGNTGYTVIACAGEALINFDLGTETLVENSDKGDYDQDFMVKYQEPLAFGRMLVALGFEPVPGLAALTRVVELNGLKVEQLISDIESVEGPVVKSHFTTSVAHACE